MAATPPGWAESMEQALARATQERRFILADFSKEH
jgi:hypothetical protein